VVRMALWESLAVVAIGLLLGGLAAAGTVLGVAAAVRDLIGISVVSVPATLVAGLVLGSAVVIGVTTLLTTVSATRTPPVRLVAARE
jgi:putative ABC transport system permease protein